MARTRAALPPGSRITDYISLGVIARWFPRRTVDRVLRDSGRASRRQRDLPAQVMVYYVIALALYMQSSYREVLRCLLEGLQWLQDPATPPKVAGDSGISQARSRLGDFSYGTRLMAYRAVDNHVRERVRGFLRRRKKVSSRGTRQFSGQVVFGKLGVVRLRRMHLGPPPATA